MKTRKQPIRIPNQSSLEQDELQRSKITLTAEESPSRVIEDPFRTVLETLLLPVTLVNKQYIYEWVNSYYAVAHGKKPSNIIQKTVSEVWGREIFDMFIKKNLDQCLGGHEVKQEAWINFSSWGRRYCETVYSPYRPLGEDSARAIVITYDITERKKAEEEIENSERRFRSLSEASLEAIAFLEDGIIVDANDALSRLFGYEGEDLQGRPAIDFIVPDRRAFTDERMRTRTTGVYETLGLRKDGSSFPFEVNSREVHINGKNLRISALRDLTERKKIEHQLRVYQEQLERLVEERTEELQKSEEKYRNIFENAIEGIYQSTLDGHFLSANPALASIFGYENPAKFMRSVTDMQKELYFDPSKGQEFSNILEQKGIVRNFEFRIRRADGATRYVSKNARAVTDERGKTLYYEGMVQDVTEKRLASEQMSKQRDLALKLAQVDSLEEGLKMILQAAINASGMECGSILLKNEVTSGFELASSIGVPKELLKKVRNITTGTPTWTRLMEGKNIHMRPNRKLTPIAFEAGYTFISIIPILRQEQVVGCMVTASRLLKEITEQARIGLEFLAAELGNIIVRMQARERLEEEIFTRRKAEKALEAERRSLQETNTALKVLLKHREEDKKELEEKFLINVKQLVLPYIEKLKASKVEPYQKMIIDFIDANLKEIISPFLNNIRSFNFTPRQLEIITLIREGKTTKEISGLLAVGKEAVDMQRFLIRKKLGINKNKTNLRSYLLSLG